MALTIKGSAFFFGKAADAPRVSFDNYFAWLKSIGSDAQWPFIPREGEVEVKRTLFCDLDAQHFFGVFLSARNAEYQHFVKKEGTRVIIEARSTDGNPPVEMNFFCLRRDSNKGIFSHYQGSYRFQQFLHDLWISYKEFVRQQKEDHIAHLSDGETKARVSPQYSLRERRCDSPLYTPGTFAQLLNRIDVVREVRATSYSVDTPADQPVSNKLKSVHKVYRLDEIPADSTIKQWLNALRQKSARRLQSGTTTHSGSVVGAEASGAELAVSFENTMEDYLEYDYDALGTFDVTTLKQHTIVRAMLEQMDSGLLFAPAEN